MTPKRFRLPVAGFLVALMMVMAASLDAEEIIPAGQTGSVEFNKLYEAILQDAGISYDMKVLPTNRKRRMFVEGEILIDCCTAKSWRNRPEEIAVQLNSREFIRSAEHYFFHRDRDAEIKSIEDLKRFSIAVVRGYVYRQEQFFGPRVAVADIAEMMRIVAAKRADIGIINPYDFRRRIKNTGLPLRMGGEHEASNLVIRVHKSRPDLLARINKVIDSYLAEDRIIKQLGPIEGVRADLIRAGRAGSAGFEAVWNAVLEDTGLNVSVVNAPQARKRMLFSSGAFALDCCSIPQWRTKPEEQEVQLFSDVIFETKERYVTRVGSGIDILHVDELKNYRVAAVRGYSYPFEDKFGIAVLANSIEDVLELVEIGRAQIAIISEIDFRRSMAQTPRQLQMGTINSRAQLRARIHRNYANLLPVLNASIAKLKDTGRLNLLLDQSSELPLP